MAELDRQIVLRRARALADQDGFEWELEARPMVPGQKIVYRPHLDDEGRERYLSRARGELSKEA